MRDITRLEKAWLADLVGDLTQLPRDKWVTKVKEYEQQSGCSFFIEPYCSVGVCGKHYGHDVGVVDTYPRDHRSIRANDLGWSPDGPIGGVMLTYGKPETPVKVEYFTEEELAL